jgi:RIO-like serine/threonine protein kinase
MDYTDHIITNLEYKDLQFLNTLYTKDALSKFQSISKEQIQEETEFKDFTFRRVLKKLKTFMFVDVANVNHKHYYYLTSFGLDIIYKIAERDEEKCVTE